MSEEEIIHTIALTQVPGIGCAWGRNLLQAAGSAINVFRNRKDLPDSLPGINDRIVNVLDCPEAIGRAEQEYEFAQKKHIECLTINDNRYPSRLKECNDAPIILFYKGSVDLNADRVINMVGTRNATDYGKQLCMDFLQELHHTYPNVLVVSGLAYGIDIQAHRAALQHGFSTVGVLAHGLDRIYPTVHRKTAIEMLNQGGLLTEFLSGSNPDRHNFVSRNRIVAGMCDATIVVESASKGGSLITAEIANGYNRDCFAFPGRVTDLSSAGCNQLIRDNKASLVLSAHDFIQQMGWDMKENKNRQTQLPLFPELSDEEQLIISTLEKEGAMQINTLTVDCDIPIYKMNSILFELEMKGFVRALAGGMYQLNK